MGVESRGRVRARRIAKYATVLHSCLALRAIPGEASTVCTSPQMVTSHTDTLATQSFFASK